MKQPLKDSSFAQVILAAGRSERMGEPKPLLRLGGKTLLQRVLEAAFAAGVDRSVVVLGVHHGAEVRAAHEPLADFRPVLWARNDDPASEQLESLKIGLRALEHEPPRAWFLHPVDCPLVRAADYRLLMDAIRAETEVPESVFVPSHARRRGHPLLCRWELTPEFLALPPGATARTVIERQPIRYVPTSNPGVLEDVDTPSDYEKLKRLVEG